MRQFKLIVIGSSAGGLGALTAILENLSPHFSVPILIAQHVGRTGNGELAALLSAKCRFEVVEAADKASIRPRTIYLAPSNYHLLVEKDGTLALSIDEPVNFSRPSIDVLFESAAEAMGVGVIGVILTGANHDGATGLAAIKRLGGITITQNPQTADFKVMPLAAIFASQVDYIAPLLKIPSLLNELTKCD